MNAPKLSTVRSAWRLEGAGTWGGYGGVLVVETAPKRVRALGKNGRALFVRRGRERVFSSPEKAFEAVESLIMRSAQQRLLLGTELDQVLEQFEFNEVPKT